MSTLTTIEDEAFDKLLATPESQAFLDLLEEVVLQDSQGRQNRGWWIWQRPCFNHVEGAYVAAYGCVGVL